MKQPMLSERAMTPCNNGKTFLTGIKFTENLGK